MEHAFWRACGPRSAPEAGWWTPAARERRAARRLRLCARRFAPAGRHLL